MDTLRADVLGVYSGSDLSPNIDALARESVVFDRAVTPIGTTLPSHSSIFTGLYPGEHSVRWNGDSLATEHLTLAEILRERGYETAAFVSMGRLLTRGGLHQGFDVRSHEVGETLEVQSQDGSEANSKARAWLESRSGERPFFMWLHHAEPHSPYPLSDYAREKLAASGYDGPFAGGLSVRQFVELGRHGKPTPEDLDALVALYGGDVLAADRLVGEAVGMLRGLDLLDETILILTADHGQALGEQGDFGHGFHLWQTVLHVPLVIRTPFSGSMVRATPRVGLVDLTPTVLDVLDLEVPPGLQGRSLVPALAGEDLAPHRYYAEVREVGNNKHREPWEAERFAILQDDVKVVLGDGDHQTFDLARDPRELGAESIRLDGDLERELLRELLAYRARILDRTAEALSEEAEAELRALGYIQ